MVQILTYSEIDKKQWKALIDCSPYATWFQTPEAYLFFKSLPNEMTPFVFGVCDNNILTGLVIGYCTQADTRLKQFFTRRAIIMGGPLLADNISETALAELLKAVSECRVESVECRVNDECRVYSVECKGNENSKAVTSAHTPYTLHHTPIYIEMRNFHDYCRWKETFEQCGFSYQEHLNFHVNTSSIDLVDQNISESRKRDIRTTIREGVTPVYEPTIEQVRAYYDILKHLYKTKVKTPLFGWEFFEELYHVEHAHYILTEYQGHIVGGSIVMELPGKAMYEWFECGLDGVGEHIHPSTYATYLGLNYAAEHGCPLFDMMGAGKPDIPYGVRDFKAKFGGELVEHGRFLCIRKPLLYWIGKMGVKWLKRR